MAGRPRLFKQIEDMVEEDIKVHRQALRKMSEVLEGKAVDARGRTVKPKPFEMTQIVKALNSAIAILPPILREMRRYKEALKNAPLKIDNADLDALDESDGVQ